MAVADAPKLTLVSGPANSGKSLWAESLAIHSGRPVLYVATGPQRPDDDRWQERIRRHRQRRPQQWGCLEVGLALPSAIAGIDSGCIGLVDSLGTWVATGLDLNDQTWQQHTDVLHTTVQRALSPLILVAEETAWGVVPPTAVGLLFRDRLAALIQQLMPLCDAAWLVLHGRALDLLSLSTPIDATVRLDPP
ncbi:MAG: adenosylcobinamide kinase/adenosylcobinamide phosphate guanyltransferase [Cyanobacteria bacterium K_DeepCast_35m_m2_023]|nr:adenosylcobinamide kinase/adenosylcobinamide phosphate guanyltransferase [Cyanobacteria bacterium K_DeepCast_35m_m2_023]